MPKMCAIPQLVSAPLNPIPTAEHFRKSHPQCEHKVKLRRYLTNKIHTSIKLINNARAQNKIARTHTEIQLKK